MTKNQKAVALLREFVKESTGIRGVVRMLKLQEEARTLLAKIDKAQEPNP